MNSSDWRFLKLTLATMGALMVCWLLDHENYRAALGFAVLTLLQILIASDGERKARREECSQSCG